MAKAETKTRSAPANFNEIVVGEVQEDDSAFVNVGYDPDHPVAQAFRRSEENGVTLRIETATPGLVAKLLRKIAQKRGTGVKIKQDDGSVTFRVVEKRQRKASAE